MTELIEALIPRLGQLDFSELQILAKFLIADRRRLQLLLDEASATNEEWRQGVDRQGQQIMQLQQELQHSSSELTRWKERYGYSGES